MKLLSTIAKANEVTTHKSEGKKKGNEVAKHKKKGNEVAKHKNNGQ